MADKWILALGASKAYADSLLKGFTDVQPKADGTGLIFTTKDGGTFEVTLPYHTHGNLSDVLEKLSINADGKLKFDNKILENVFVDTRENFPTIGFDNVIYIDKINNSIYIWNSDTNSYTILSIGGNGEENKINGININGVQQPISDDKIVDIDVPTKISELVNDSNFIDDTKVASRDDLGLVKIDGSSITISDGVISANVSNLIDDTQANDNKTYSSTKIESDFAKIADVLTLTNTIVYTPTGDYHPVTKKYVDNAISALNGIMEIKSRVDSVGDLPSDANTGDVYYVGLEDADSFETYVKLSNGDWLRIGSTETKLTDYYTKLETNNLLNTKVSICGTLPTASINYYNQCYFNTNDGCIYQCILDETDYKWDKIVSNESPIYRGNVEPTDKSKIWIDTSDFAKILIKIYDETNSKWIILNNIPTEFVKNITYANNKLTIINSDDTISEIPIGSGTGGTWDYNELYDIPILNGKEFKGEHDGDYYGLMDKDVYASTQNEGSVKKADVAKHLEYLADNTDPFTYAGHNSQGIEGAYPLPIGMPDESKIQKREFNDVTVGFEMPIESRYALNDKAIISVKKLVNESTNTDITVKSFDTDNEITFNHTKNTLIENDGTSIKKVYEETPVVNSDGFFEIDLSAFKIINGCEVIN